MSEYKIEGARLHTLICNAQRLLGKRYKKSPLWSLVSDLTGHGSTISTEICQQCGIDPGQPCDSKYLKKLSSSVEAAQSEESLSSINKAPGGTEGESQIRYGKDPYEA